MKRKNESMKLTKLKINMGILSLQVVVYLIPGFKADVITLQFSLLLTNTYCFNNSAFQRGFLRNYMARGYGENFIKEIKKIIFFL